MKPIAYMGHYDTDNIREAGCVVTRDKDDLKFQRNGKPDRIDELYTATQLREAHVRALKTAYRHVLCLPAKARVSDVLDELRRMADEIERSKT